MNYIQDENPQIHREWSLLEKINNKYKVVMINLPLDENGYPVLKINVLNTKTEKDGQVRGLVDTGANRSLMKKRVFDVLGLELKGGEATTSGVGDKQPKKMHGYADMGINLPRIMGNTDVFEYTFLVENEIEGDDNRPWDVLLGTDFLEHCNFEYKGQEKTFGIEFLLKKKES